MCVCMHTKLKQKNSSADLVQYRFKMYRCSWFIIAKHNKKLNTMHILSHSILITRETIRKHIKSLVYNSQCSHNPIQ